MIQISKGLLLIICILVLSLNLLPAQDLSNNHRIVPRPRVALVLEGGGALGLAHIGVIKVLEELGIPVDIVVGTSMGAIVGGLYAQGFDGEKLETIALEIDWLSIFLEGVNPSEERYRRRIDRSYYFGSVDFDRRGFKMPGSLLSGRKLLYFLDRLTIPTVTPSDFDTLPRRYRAVAADLASGERVVIDKGSLADAMRASMGIPGIFTTHLIDGRYLIDGGVVDNLPVGTARDLGADLIIAVDLLGGIPFESEEFDRSPRGALNRTVDIMVRENIKKQLPKADLVITVDLTGYQVSDFAKEEEIMGLGVKAAQENKTQLIEFKRTLGVFPSSEAKVEPVMQSPIQKIIVTGGDSKGRARAYQLFAPVIGTVPDEALLESAITSLEALGIYEFIRVQRIDEADVPALEVKLTKYEPSGQSLRLGLNYYSTYSGSTISNISLFPSVIFRGLTSDNSRLVINLRMLDSPALEAAFLQPLGEIFFVESFFSAHQDSDIFGDDLAIDYVYQSQALDLGITFGGHPARWAEGAISFQYEWVDSDHVPGIRAGQVLDSLPMGRGLFSIHRLDSPILPMKGVLAKLQYDRSLWPTSEADTFQILQVESLYIPALDIPFAFSFWGKAESDFSQYADASNAAPFHYKPDLAGRHFFPGPLELNERKGSHIAAFGGELKLQQNWVSLIIGVPSFISLQGAVGTVLQNFSEIDRAKNYTHWNTMLGVGARLNDGFGASLRAGIMGGFRGDLRPFFTLDVGSIGY